jgi:hypothetical protein
MSKPTSDWWQEVSPYLDRALEMTDEQRASWLESLRGENPTLALQLESLLDEQRMLEGERFLEANPLAVSDRAELSGQPVGAYTLRSLIGEGGMGSVWLAERSDGRFERRAAIKFLRAPLHGPAVAQRF